MIKKSACIIIFILLCSYLCRNNLGRLFEKDFSRYNTIVSEKSTINTNKKYSAIKFKRNINSTTRISYHLSIIEENEHPISDTGNVYVSYQDFDYKWIDDVLIIQIHKNDEIFKKATSYRDVVIKYELND